MRLKRKFFDRDTLIVVQELLGKYLVRKIPSASSGQVRKVIRTRITETEAYCGPLDKASHASKGLTPRTKIMFGQSGHAYVYMIYGMYFCLNFVTEKEGYPAAVLIRGVDLASGPGRLCRELKINKKLNEIDITSSKELWIESASRRRKEDYEIKIKKSKRIGVDYAGKWKNKLWRFYIDLE